MNSKYHRTNLLLFTLERCDDYNGYIPGLPPWYRVQSHKIGPFHPPWGPFERTRVHAVLSFLGSAWDDLFRIRL